MDGTDNGISVQHVARADGWAAAPVLATLCFMARPGKLEPLFLLSDEPIGSHTENAFTDDPFARTIARAALRTKGPFTIGVYGGWGSGKTSALGGCRTNHRRRDLEQVAELRAEGVNRAHLRLAEVRRDIVERFGVFEFGTNVQATFPKFAASLLADGGPQSAEPAILG